MPIYEYVCRKCGEQFDAVQPNPAPCPPCPQCGEEENIDRKMGAPNFVVRGYSAKNGYSK